MYCLPQLVGGAQNMVKEHVPEIQKRERFGFLCQVHGSSGHGYMNNSATGTYYYWMLIKLRACDTLP